MKKITQLKAIRAKCLDCSAGSPSEVKVCPVTDCSLWPFRFGIAPKTAAKRGYSVNPKSLNLLTER